MIQEYKTLGYPHYFVILLIIFKAAGALVILLPSIPSLLKEWAYAGFSFVFIFAFISHIITEGFTLKLIFPLIILEILMVSYWSYHRFQQHS